MRVRKRQGSRGGYGLSLRRLLSISSQRCDNKVGTGKYRRSKGSIGDKRNSLLLPPPSQNGKKKGKQIREKCTRLDRVDSNSPGTFASVAATVGFRIPVVDVAFFITFLAMRETVSCDYVQIRLL